MINLSQREKRLMILLGTLVSVIILVFLIILPIMNFIDNNRKKSESSVADLTRLDKLYQEYTELDQKMKKIESQIGDPTAVASMIEEKSESEGILKNKVYVRDSPGRRQGNFMVISTDVKFEGVAIEPLLKFIYGMESSNRLIKISYLRVNKAIRGRNAYDAQIKFDCFTKQ